MKRHVPLEEAIRMCQWGAEMSEISFERQRDYGKDVYLLSPVLFSIFLQKIMGKALTPQNDCFAGEAAGGAEETDILLSSVSIGGR